MKLSSIHTFSGVRRTLGGILLYLIPKICLKIVDCSFVKCNLLNLFTNNENELPELVTNVPHESTNEWLAAPI